MLSDIDSSIVTNKVFDKIYPGVATMELDELAVTNDSHESRVYCVSW